MNEINEIFGAFTKSPLRFLKRNFNLIIILPALLGGIWQIIELSRMSFSFIRFFSVGQIIPDGLLILLFLIIFSISTFVLIYYWKKLDSEVEEQNEIIQREHNSIYVIIFAFLFYVSIALILWLNNYLLDNIESLFNLFIFVPVNMIVTLMSIFFCKLSMFYCKKNSEAFKEFRKLMKIMLFLPYGIQLVILLSLGRKFHEVFILPEKLKNVDNLICKMEKVDSDANFEILYSNDKYVFVECHKFTKDRNGKPRQSEIRIFKFEDLLDDSACIGNKRIEQERIKDSIKYYQIGLPQKTK